MTDIDQLDLFSPTQRRERVVDWQVPAPVAKAAMGLSGMDAMLGIRDGRLPPPPFAKLIGFTMAVVEPGRIVMQLEPREDLENTIGLLHGATAAALIDTRHGMRHFDPAGGRAVVRDPRSENDVPASAVGPVRADHGRRQDHQAGTADQLHRGVRPRRQGGARSPCNCNLFHDWQYLNMN
ncbi:hypothetical protein ACVME8_007383 [Bradyrhizobium diazoefficiens]